MVFEFGTWNIRTLYRAGALTSIMSEIKKYNVQVTAVQEIRWHGSGIDEYKSHTVLYSGKSGGTHEHGVAFIVDNSIRNNIIDFIPVNKRICIIRLRMKFFNIAMVNIYAPTEEKEANLKDEFYQQLERSLDALPTNDVKVVLGDCNAKIGKEEQFRSTIGKNSLHDESNDNGRRLIDFAESKNMIICSTQFPHKNIHKQTWRSPDGETANQIDHIMVDKRRATSITDVRSYRGADGDTDHYLAKAKYVCRISRTSRKTYEHIPKIKITALKEQKIQESYMQSLAQRLKLKYTKLL